MCFGHACFHEDGTDIVQGSWSSPSETVFYCLLLIHYSLVSPFVCRNGSVLRVVGCETQECRGHHSAYNDTYFSHLLVKFGVIQKQIVQVFVEALFGYGKSATTDYEAGPQLTFYGWWSNHGLDPHLWFVQIRLKLQWKCRPAEVEHPRMKLSAICQSPSPLPCEFHNQKLSN